MNARLVRCLTLTTLLMVATATVASAQTYWFETYQTAVDKIEGQQPEEIVAALTMLEVLVAEYPVPQMRVRIPGDRYVDYLPYYQQARVQALLGQDSEARHSLDIAEAFVAVSSNRRAMTAIRELRGTLDRRTAATP